ncbi:MAG: DUF4382 domain-containing protein [Bacteroidia bacterium]
MRRRQLFITISLVAFALIAFELNSCSKDAVKPSTAQVSFRLTDAPCDYDHLYIDIEGMEIHSDSNGWESILPFNAGVYDLLTLTNGLDTLLCTTELPEGTISQIRLLLGDNNEIVVNGTNHDIKIPSGSQSGLKLNLHQHLDAGTSYNIWLDFDACKSVVEKGNGQYSLKPVIRTFADSTNGKLKGYVQPDSLPSYVYVINNNDSILSITNPDGFFMICGLDGTYDVWINPTDTTVSDSLISSVNVDFGEIVDLDTVNLK